MYLVVATPIGPGHKEASVDCNTSVWCAWARSHGPFTSFDHVLWDDTKGEHGRSRARNAIVESNPDADWFMFLDADDLCEDEAFKLFGSALRADPELMAVFGSVQTDQHGTIPDNKWPLTWDELLRYGADGTLSMGCFVRAAEAKATPFNETMDGTEDFEFYMRLLHQRHWTKIQRPLVNIRTSLPSAVGPRGYITQDWRGACRVVVDNWIAQNA